MDFLHTENCLTHCYIFFAGALIINAVRDFAPKRWAKYIPLPIEMAIPFYLESYFVIDMCVGSLVLFTWEKIDKVKADAFGPAVASGLICGDGIWTLPSSILALAGVKPPICMKFLSRGTNVKVDKFSSSSAFCTFGNSVAACSCISMFQFAFHFKFVGIDSEIPDM